MFIDLAKETHLTRLDKAIKHSTRALRPFRDNRSKLIKDYVGSQYGSQNYDRQEIIQNLMYQTAETYTMALAANRPRCLITSLHPELTWFANQFQVAINNLIKEIKLEETLRAAVLDAFFRSVLSRFIQPRQAQSSWVTRMNGLIRENRMLRTYRSTTSYSTCRRRNGHR